MRSRLCTAAVIVLVGAILLVSTTDAVSARKIRNKNGKITYFWNDQTSSKLFDSIRNVELPPSFGASKNRVVSMINRDILSIRFLGNFQLIHCEGNLGDALQTAGLLAQQEKYKVVLDWTDLTSMSDTCVDPTGANLFGGYTKYAATLKTTILYNAADENMAKFVKDKIKRAQSPVPNLHTLSAVPGSSLDPLQSGRGV